MADVKELEVQANLLEKEIVPTKKENIWFRTLRSCSFMPQRYVVCIMGMLGTANAYTMRVCLNLAITQMVNDTVMNTEHFDPNACPSDEVIRGVSSNDSAIVLPKPHALFDWNEETQGFILSAFYYGYATTQILGGFLIQKFGAKWVLGIGMSSTAMFTFIVPLMTRWGGMSALFALRVIQGMGEGPCMPALMSIMSKWIPPQERSFQGAIVFGGSQLGSVFGSFISGLLLSGGRDWAYVFYLFSVMGVLWCIFWSILCYSSPNTHPYISQKELDYLNQTVTIAGEQDVQDPIPWRAILRSGAVWALVAAAIGHDWGYYTMITDLPKYAHDVLKFNIASTGILTSLPFLSLWLSSFIFGFVCDYCIKKGYHSAKTGRIIHTSIATTGPGVCIILASYCGCNRTAAMIYFITSMALMGGYNCGMKVNCLDIAPNNIATVISLSNTASTLTGIISPYLVGLLTPDSTLSQWRIVFWVCFAFLIITNIIYCIWMDGKQQWWDDVRQHGYPTGWKEKYGPLLKDEIKGGEAVKIKEKFTSTAVKIV